MSEQIRNTETIFIQVENLKLSNWCYYVHSEVWRFNNYWVIALEEITYVCVHIHTHTQSPEHIYTKFYGKFMRVHVSSKGQ